VAVIVRVSKGVRWLLNALKKTLSSREDVLQNPTAVKITVSMFGSNPRLSRFREEEEAEFHEL